MGAANQKRASLGAIDRGAAIIDIDAVKFKVGGEWCLDNTWWVFPKMVYVETASGHWELLDSEVERNQVIELLRQEWPVGEASLKLVVDES